MNATSAISIIERFFFIIFCSLPLLDCQDYGTKIRKNPLNRVVAPLNIVKCK